MTGLDDFLQALARCPLVAILRGVLPEEVEDIADALVEAGFVMIEVPLNSPRPLDSIGRIAERYGSEVLIGAGTVTSVAQVEAVYAAGGRLVVSPNTDPAVIARAVERKMVSLPGFFTPSEAFLAAGAGAHGLKFFPASAGTPSMLSAIRAVLPADAPLLAVGGVTVHNLGEWLAAGANGAGLGSDLYKPGRTATEVGAIAQAYVAKWRSSADEAAVAVAGEDATPQSVHK